MPITFEQLTRRWLDTVASVTLKPSGFKSYEAICRLHVVPALGHLPVADLTAPMVEDYVADKIRAGLSPRTVANHVQVIRRVLEYGYTCEVVDKSSASKVKLPRQEPAATRLRYLAPEELQRLYEATPTAWRILIAMAFMCGLRKGEQLSLTFRDIDFGGRTISVSKSIRNGVVTSPKTPWSIGSIPLPESLVPLLEERRKKVADPDGLIFCRADGSPLPDGLPNRILVKALDKAGLRQVTWHEMGRHSWVVAHLQAGTDIPTLQRLGRWKTADVLLSVYSHVMPASGGEAADRLDQLMHLNG